MRDCENCVRNTPGKGCTSWDCDYISRKEAIEAWLEKHRTKKAEERRDRQDEAVHASDR